MAVTTGVSRRSWLCHVDAHDQVIGQDDRSTAQSRADPGTLANLASRIAPRHADERGALDHHTIARNHLAGDAEDAVADRQATE